MRIGGEEANEISTEELLKKTLTLENGLTLENKLTLENGINEETWLKRVAKTGKDHDKKGWDLP